ncbi:hypothetical protein [Psychroserpens sp. SPM9]|uniref:hypothetical protein n=1 Tax=Psychroserpens sp. SPM9 TaxID=2975598 RepID=UPI0021A7FFF1|nr:hypothetical protein [Psychroserpens sp. SPM9]MDG5490655.1 hypothetical protein [Psychroserpens sp. SPM9]
MKKFRLLVIICALLISGSISSQEKELGSILEMNLESIKNPLAQVTEKERLKMDNLKEGIFVYQTDGISGLYYFTGKDWVPVKANNDVLKSLLICATKIITIDTVSELDDIHNNCGTDINTAIVLGYHEKHDGGGGVFVYDNTLANENDGGLVFDGWKRSLVDSALNVKWFGAKGDGGDTTDLTLISNNTIAFQNTLSAFKRKFRFHDFDALVSNRQSYSGIFIPSGEYIIGADALFTDDIDSNYNVRLAGINYFSDGNAILSLTNTGNTYAFRNLDRGLFITFQDITFIGNSSTTNAFYSESNGGAQDYLFERCTFLGRYNRVFTIRGGTSPNTNSEWSFEKCSFNGEIQVIMDVKDSGQFLNYWFNETKFWSKIGSTIISDNGGHFKFVNCDWSGFEPESDTYIFELRDNNASRGVNDFRIINGRFELKNEHARVLKSNWNQGNIEINADFGSQVFKFGLEQQDPNFIDINTLKHFEFNLQGTGTVGNSLNVNFKNSVMMGYHDFNYQNNSWRGTGKILYENCSFPHRNSLDDFVRVNHGFNNNISGIANIEIRDAIFENNYGVSGVNFYTLEASSVNFYPSYSNSGLKKKYIKIAHPARGENPLAGQSFTLNFPEEAESIITKVSWYLPKNRLTSIRTVQFALTDINNVIITDDFNSSFELKSPLAMMKDGFRFSQDVYVNIKNLPEGKLVLKDITNQADQVANEFMCVIEYY